MLTVTFSLNLAIGVILVSSEPFSKPFNLPAPIPLGFPLSSNFSLSPAGLPQTCQVPSQSLESHELIYKYDQVTPSGPGVPFRNGFFKISCHPNPNGLETESEPFCIFLNPAMNRGKGMVVVAKPALLLESLQTRLDFTQEPPESDAIKVVKMPHKGGMGALAARRLELGERVNYERAALVVSVERSTWDRPDWKEIRKLAVDALPLQTRGNLARLYGKGHTQEEWISNMIDMNAFEIKLGDKQDVPFFAVLAHASRLNHECRPNTAFYTDLETLEVHMTTLREINAGEELTISYHDMTMTRSDRQKDMLHYGFVCSCAHCRMSEELADESDRRIVALIGLKAQLSNWTHVSKEKEQMDEAEELLELHSLEKLYDTVSDSYTLAALVFNSFGRVSRARKYATQALVYGLITSGPKWDEAEGVQQLADDPQSHWSYRLQSDD
ncbi:hypothetical protein O181_007372 [Austropuccinia psidii MF-1]|uniref:SET domain-containing protein n=1 Tax=Austropuccinia psidii MF-1 TaxID=1389203 RepID=A0A9Q3BML8_9BASI|nr:hypothetical protein [Austropuccinia psidii MF-1]